MHDSTFTLTGALILLTLAFAQNVSFSIVSRSRNRSSMTYHLIASVFSNGIWFLTFRSLVLAEMTLYLFPFYTVGTVAGSLYGVALSMKIERWLKAGSDDHIKRTDPEVEALKRRVAALEQTAGGRPTAETLINAMTGGHHV